MDYDNLAHFTGHVFFQLLRHILENAQILMSLENRNKSQFLGIVVKRAITFRLATDLDRTVKTSALLTACKAPCSVATKCKQYRLVACSPAVAYVPCKRIGLYTIRRSILRCVADSSTLHVLMMIDFFF